MTEFGLYPAATQERLARIEKYLGITEPTPAQAQLDALLDATEGDE